MGKFFAEKKYRKELPYIKNTKHKRWLLCLDNEKVIGFMAHSLKNKILSFSNGYVVRSHRKKGIYAELVKRTEEITSSLEYKKQKITIKHLLYDFWKEKGFCVIRKTKNYIFMEKINEVD